MIKNMHLVQDLLTLFIFLPLSLLSWSINSPSLDCSVATRNSTGFHSIRPDVRYLTLSLCWNIKFLSFSAALWRKVWQSETTIPQILNPPDDEISKSAHPLYLSEIALCHCCL